MVFASKADKEDAKNHKVEKQGMVYDRQCTDILFCILFIVFCVGMIGVSGFALATGEPSKALTPFDSDGNLCGGTDQIASVGKYIGDNEVNDYTSLQKTNFKNYFDDLKPRDFSEYKYRVYTNLQGLLKPDITQENIYQAVCAKACPKIDPSQAKLVDGRAVLEFDIMATTNFTDVSASTADALAGKSKLYL
jgi:hypothetical protein